MTAGKPQVIIYTDGGATPNPGRGGWAALLLFGEHKKELSGGDPDTTNNRMELMAAIAALEALKKPCRVSLYTDSEYLQRGITEWLPDWVEHGWKKAGGKRAVKNQDLWQRLHAAIQPHEIDWRWTRGHAGNPYNERVDWLAAQAQQRLRT